MGRSWGYVQLLCAVWALHAACLVHGRLYAEGDYIAAARKSQYGGQRTQWHDMLGRHCPRFGRDATVVLPIEEPKDGRGTPIKMSWTQGSSHYKIMLSFDAERVVTPWITILHPSKFVYTPLVKVTLTAYGSELRSVHVTVSELPEKMIGESVLKNHKRITNEWKDAEKWPKHLVVQYRWEMKADEDAELGLFVLLATTLIMCALLALTARLKFGPSMDASMYELVASLDSHEPGVPESRRRGDSAGSLAPPPPPRVPLAVKPRGLSD